MSDHDASPADPEELDFTDDESVVEIGEGRYVVGTNGRPNVRPGRPPGDSNPAQGSGAADATGGSGFESTATPSPAADREPIAGDDRGVASDPSAGASPASGGTPAGDVDRQAVSRWLATSFDNDGFDYGIDATLHAKGETARNRSASNDVVSTFDTLLSWFVSNAGPDTDAAEALGLLLVAGDTPIDLPPVAIKRFAASQNLSADDSIGDLVRAAEQEGGFRVD